MSFQPRFANGVYRDCKWCGGRGCLSCEAEADKEYKRQFPDGPKPIASFSTVGMSGDEVGGILAKVLGSKAIDAASKEASVRADRILEENPGVVELVGATKEQCKSALEASLLPEVIADGFKQLAEQHKTTTLPGAA